MRSTSRRAQLDAQHAARRQAQTAVRRLAVDEKARSARRRVRGARAVAPALFADDKEEADARLAVAP